MQIRNLIACTALICAQAAVHAQGPTRAQKIARGRYLAEQVAMCGDCHTPHTPKGEPDESRRLAGADLPFTPLRPMPWAGTAPKLAGLPGWTEPELVRLLTTGLNLKGERPKPPMPPYRFSRADAEAVAAYLKSLGEK